ncbi:MAG TPA: DUF1622 domain-containing protein [Methanotrichaceae archaeon]|nr:DUF1622 domain-containing protein [Methanotrichaceae archaeon]
MSTEVVEASNMTTTAAEASHEIAVWIELSVRLIEALSVIIITLAILYATYIFIRRVTGRKGTEDPLEEYKERIGKALLLVLEILVAADVIETVAFSKTFESIALLGALVVVRILLSWSIVVEMEGTWPWKRHAMMSKGKPEEASSKKE